MYKVVDHHTDQGHRVALIFKQGRKWTHLVYYDYPIRVRKVLNNEERYWKHLTKYDTSKGMKYAIKKVREMAREYYGLERNIPKSLKKVYKF
mgnify:FL=1|jgi:hypothetical protein